MAVEHDFSHPRNLYEKLERDAEKLDNEVNGDNLFNFMATACHLQNWIKKEDGLRSDSAVKRLLVMLHDDNYIRLCSDILEAKKHFKIYVDIINGEMVADIEGERVNILDLKAEIMNIYHTYFHVKGN